MANKFLQFWKLKDLRKKILLTVLLLVLVRLLAHIPVPGVDVEALQAFFKNSRLFGLMDVFAGGTMSRFSIAMMGVGPYINASIIAQLLTHVIPALENLQKEGGDEGRKKISQYTRWLTVPLAILQAYGMTMLLKSQQAGDFFKDIQPTDLAMMMVVITAGTILMMWLGELITENGIGNGTSLIIALGIVAGLPSIIQNFQAGYEGINSWMSIGGIILLSIVVITAIVYTNEGSRLIPVSYARRVRGMRLYGGMDSHLPIKINVAGVIPIIFAMSFMIFPSILSQLFSNARTEWIANVAKWMGEVLSLNPPTVWYIVAYFVLVMLFTFFYTSVIFNPKEISENIQKQGGFVPGIRPGSQTMQYLGFIINRLTASGAFFLAIIAVLPMLFGPTESFDTLIGGTSVLIIVSVVLETARQMKAQIVMRSYDEY